MSPTQRTSQNDCAVADHKGYCTAMWKAAKFQAQPPLATVGIIVWRPVSHHLPSKHLQQFVLGWTGSNVATIFEETGNEARNNFVLK